MFYFACIMKFYSIFQSLTLSDFQIFLGSDGILHIFVDSFIYLHIVFGSSQNAYFWVSYQTKK